MFHRIIFLLLIVSTVSCNFNRCADCFQSFSEQLFPEYSKCHALNGFKIKNKHNKFFIMLERNCVNVHSNFKHSPLLALQKSEPAARIDDFENFFNGLRLKRTRASIVLNIECVHVETQTMQTEDCRLCIPCRLCRLSVIFYLYLIFLVKFLL